MEYKKTCLQCGKSFKTKFKEVKFCSFRCSGKYNAGVKHVETDSKHKYCSKCNRVLPLKAFSKSTGREKNVQSFCKFCMSMWTRNRRGFNLSYDDMLNLLNKQDWKCAICGKSLKDAYEKPWLLGNKNKHYYSISIDHVKPGGKDLALTHQICNLSKSNRNMEELVIWCEDVIKFNEEKNEIQ